MKRPDDQEAVLKRLDYLERQNRLLRTWAGIGGFILFGSLFRAAPVLSQGKPGKIEATAFVLRDDAGRVRAALSNLPGGGAALTVFDTSQHVRLLVGMQGNGQPSLQLNDDKEVGRGVFGLDEYGSAGCDLGDRQGRIRLRLNVADRQDGEASALTFRDAQGHSRVMLVNGDRISGLMLLGSKEEPLSTVTASIDGTAMSMIHGKDGKTLWAAP